MDVVLCDSFTVRKRARTGEDRRRLAIEARALSSLAHPGVVRVLEVEGADPPDSIVLQRVAGPSFEDLGEQPVEVLAGLGAAIATVLSDLHALGVAHGAVQAGHILIDEGGRPVLCSLGRSVFARSGPGFERRRREDVRALALVLLDRLPPGTRGRLRRTLTRVAEERLPGRASARGLAAALVAATPGACLPELAPGSGRPGPDDCAPEGPAPEGPAPEGPAPGGPGPVISRRRLQRGVQRRTQRAAAGALLLASGIAATTWLLLPRPAPAGRRGAMERADAPAASRRCPAADDGCVALASTGGKISVGGIRYAVGAPGDVVVVGRWTCGGTAFPALLRPATGQVWVFDAWAAPARPVTGRLVAQIRGVVGLRVHPGPSGCDLLVGTGGPGLATILYRGRR